MLKALLPRRAQIAGAVDVCSRNSELVSHSRQPTSRCRHDISEREGASGADVEVRQSTSIRARGGGVAKVFSRAPAPRISVADPRAAPRARGPPKREAARCRPLAPSWRPVHHPHPGEVAPHSLWRRDVGSPAARSRRRARWHGARRDARGAAAACTEISSAQARCRAAPAPRFLWGLHVVIVGGAGAKLFSLFGCAGRLLPAQCPPDCAIM